MINRVKELIAILDKENTGIESVALWQDGEMKLVHRYVPAGPRLIYSHTKSFISTAAGIAIDEGLLTLDTTVAELFPEYESVITDERVKAARERMYNV